IALVFSATAQAATILVDFGLVAKRHSVGSADGNGNYWDYITGSTDNNTDLTDTGGNTTSIDLQMVSGFTGPADYNFGYTPNAGLNGGNFAFTNVTDDAIYFLGSETPQMTLSGLNNLYAYSFVFYGSRVSTDDRWTTYTIGGNNQQLQTSGSPLTDNWNSDTVVSINNVFPSGGQITINLSSSTGASGSNYGYINAMQITEDEDPPEPPASAPEPSTAMLLMAGGFLLKGLRRRRKTA
ncbi:MAG: PEP-CTERM sorting domain-containing protein, partial [Verrucomicrobia bacterium]|nr:PEP-CTERM sorting domain-containing protein [Verrucomicrobiota bacterium]